MRCAGGSRQRGERAYKATFCHVDDVSDMHGGHQHPRPFCITMSLTALGQQAQLVKFAIEAMILLS